MHLHSTIYISPFYLPYQTIFPNSIISVSGGFQTSPSRAPLAQQSLVETSTCNERLGQLVGDIFIGHEMIPQVLDLPPDYPLELTYRTVRTFPGMRLTAEVRLINLYNLL